MGSSTAASRSSWPQNPRSYRWLIDGHNTIFADSQLERLQTGGDRAAARHLLEAMLGRFATQRGLRVLIVYDGNRRAGNPDVLRGGNVSTQYSQPPEEADDRILHLAESAIHHRERVVVVTSDRALAARLPKATRCVDPTDLLRQIRMRPAREKEVAPPPGDFSDIEAHFLTLDPIPEEASSSPPSKTRLPVDRDTDVKTTTTPDGKPRDESALERKRARGRRKQLKRAVRNRQSHPRGKKRRR